MRVTGLLLVGGFVVFGIATWLAVDADGPGAGREVSAAKDDAGETAADDRAKARPGLVPAPAAAIPAPAHGAPATASGGAVDAASAPAPTPAETRPPSSGRAEPPAASDEAPAPVRVPRAANAEGIRAAVADARPELVECYESWLAQHPGLGGRLVVRFEIRPGPEPGAPAEVADVGLADSSLAHTLLEGCVQNVFGSLAFEPVSEPVKVNYPVGFSGSPLDAAVPDAR